MKNGLIIDFKGNKYWYLNGKRHRENDLPAVEWADGTKEWYLNCIEITKQSKIRLSK